MPPEIRLLAWKSWRDVKARLGWGLLVLAGLVGLAFVGRSMLLARAPGDVWGELGRRAGAVGVTADDLSGFLRFWWHEGGARPGLLVLAALLGAAGPGLDPGAGSRLLHASLPVRPALPTAVQGVVASVALVAASVWVSLLALAGSAVTGPRWPLVEAGGMAATGVLLALPAVGVGLLAAALVRRRWTSAITAVVGVWGLGHVLPLLGRWATPPAPTYDGWAPAGGYAVGLSFTAVLFVLSPAIASKVRP